MISFSSLKKRKVVQWAIAYVAGAWAILQVADLLSDTYAWPAVVMRILPLVLVAGFLAALVLAWYHGEQGRQKASTVELGLLAGVLLLGGAAVGSMGVSPGADGAETDASTPGSDAAAVAEQGSIAVLPFENMSANEDNEYFSDGISEELLNILAQLPELRVAARTSAFAFKGTDVGIDSIARALNVRHVLEGSVRRAGDQVRITAQLIDATTGYHVWSETYDRRLDDVFAIQDEIASRIVDQLEIRLARRSGPLARVQTTDAEAHQRVLRARQLILVGNMHTHLPAAELLYEEAIARDSGYAAAWAGLANVHRLQVEYDLAPADETLERARAEAERALTLDPDEHDAHLVLGAVAWIEGQASVAGEHIRKALRRNPGDTRALSFYSGWLAMQGRLEEGRQMALRAVALDPLSGNSLTAAGRLARATGDLDQAAEMFTRAAVLSPDDSFLLGELGMVQVLRGERAEALRLAERMLDIAPHGPFETGRAGWIHAYGREFERALELFRRAVALAPEDRLPLYLADLANMLAGMGEDEEAVFQVERAAQLDPGNTAVQTILGYVYARAGRRADAERMLQQVPEDDPISRAAIRANLGETDRAFALLEQAVEERTPGFAELGADWWFDDLRSDPRMDRLLARIGVPHVALDY